MCGQERGRRSHEAEGPPFLVYAASERPSFLQQLSMKFRLCSNFGDAGLDLNTDPHRDWYRQACASGPVAVLAEQAGASWISNYE